jgi:hypothetical protein
MTTILDRAGGYRRFAIPLVLAWLVLPRPAAALDFQCVESSKYQYLYQLFNGDPKQAAAYLGVDPAHGPPAGACRAVVATGGVEPGDDAKLITAIAQSGGWLATLYLASGGGSVDSGSRLAVITRAFWLKTIVAPTKSFRYQPDFMPAPIGTQYPAGDLTAALQAYEHAVDAVPATTVPFPGCASACTFALAAGIDRRGVARVHRAGVGASSIEAVTEGVDRAEERIVAIYQKMDVGDDFIRDARDTAKQTTTPTTIARFPRPVEDFLVEKCKSDAAQLDDLKALLQFGIANGGSRAGDLVQTATLRQSLAKAEARSEVVERCVAGYQESERLKAFNQLCGHGCSAESLAPVITKKLGELKE